MSDPVATPKTTYGRRYCVQCDAVERHASTRRLSQVGRRLLWLAGFITLGLLAHSWVRFDANTPALWMLWLMPPIGGLVVVALALRHHAFDVECKRCKRVERKASEPHWVDESGDA